MTRAEQFEAAGMRREVAASREELFRPVDDALRASGAAGETVHVFVPGRVEVLGKHTDYAGGRSLVCAVERGFAVAAAPRADREVRLVDVAGRRVARLALEATLPEPADAWARYPATVFRRVARNFPDAGVGADLAFLSDLPLASGMSSSSAFMVAMFLAVAALNRLHAHPVYRRAIDSREALAGYLATVENGQSYGVLSGDRGVGTLGGSEDHTAMLCGRPGELSQYSFCPVRHERQVPFPSGHVLVVAVSGVVAEKTGAAREAYNRASLMVRAILDAWNAVSGRTDPCLAAAVANGAGDRLGEVLPGAAGAGFEVQALQARFEQFVEESMVLIPAAGDALAAGDLARFATLVDRSQDLTERLLRNQVPETVALARSARELGAVAASAFGAGFGGSVWALVPAASAEGFAARWASCYTTAFPAAAGGAAFLVTRPGIPGIVVPPGVMD